MTAAAPGTAGASAMSESPVAEASAMEGPAAEEERRREIRPVAVPVRIAIGVPVWITVRVGIGFVLRIGRFDWNSFLSRIVGRFALVTVTARTAVETRDPRDGADHGLADAGLAEPDQVIGVHVRIQPRAAGLDVRHDRRVRKAGPGHLHDVVEETVREARRGAGLRRRQGSAQEKDRAEGQNFFHGVRKNLASLPFILRLDFAKKSNTMICISNFERRLCD